MEPFFGAGLEWGGLSYSFFWGGGIMARGKRHYLTPESRR